MTVDAGPPSSLSDDDAPDPFGDEYETLYRHALQAAHERDEQLAMLAHELRNPLNALQTSVEVLSRASPGSPEAGSARDIIGRQVRKLTQLVDLRLPAGGGSAVGLRAGPPQLGVIDVSPDTSP